MPAWPATLPEQPLAGTLILQRVPNVVVFEPDIGPNSRRRRQTATGTDIQAGMLLTEAQLETLDDFFENDCADGALSFTMADWQTSETKTFTWNAPPVATLELRIDRYRVALSLRREP